MYVHDFGVGSVYEEALFYTRWEGVARTALLMVDMVSIVHLRCAFGDREAVRVVLMYSPGSGLSCYIIDLGACATRMLAWRAWSAESRSFLRFRDCSSYM